MLIRLMIVASVFALLPAFSCNSSSNSRSGARAAGQGNQVVAPPMMVKSAEEIKQLETLVKENPKNVNGWITLGNAQMTPSGSPRPSSPTSARSIWIQECRCASRYGLLPWRGQPERRLRNTGKR